LVSLLTRLRFPVSSRASCALSASSIFRGLRRGLLAVSLALLLLAAGFSEFNPSAIDLAVAPHKYSILDWELSNLPDKWLRKLTGVFSGAPALSREDRIAQVQEFFQLGLELDQMERELQFPETVSAGKALSATQAESLQDRIVVIEERRQRLRPGVEDTIESEVSAVLAQEGLGSKLGVFPPVDAVFSRSPHVLIVSPRDRIVRQQDVLLNPGLSSIEKEQMEKRILREEDLSALIEDTGGVAVYPSVVMDNAGLHHAVATTTHESLHHWLFFRPLGRAFWSSPEMTTLNETVATIAGEELGDRVFTALTGEVVDRTPLSSTEAPDSNGFDFRTEMRETRLQAEELLARGKIEEAEAYMEERRQLFVANGYLLRKINQAFFAFHGTYATSPASVSPIGDQVKDLRERSGSTGEFLNTVAQFSTYREFLEYLEGLRADQNN
jgi:hypothetical protein